MKKPALKLVYIGLILIFILSACGKTGSLTENPNTDTAKLEAENKEKDLKIVELETKTEELEANEDTKQTTLEPTGEILSIEEAQDLLINWYEENEISYMPEMDKQDEGVKLYGFLVDYSDTYCYAWVNSSTGIINFEEAGPNLYSNIPDSMFPIPIHGGVVIPYDGFSPPDYAWGVAYSYEDKSVMKSYQAQLKEVGFVDHGTVQSVESLWQYEQSSDGTIFIVEMYSDGENFTMTMYVNNFNY